MGKFSEFKQDAGESLRQHPAIWIAALLGSALVMGVPLLFAHEPLIFRLGVCIGFGMLLSAAGSAATVRWRGATLVGAAAIALVLFFALDQAERNGNAVQFVRIKAVNPSGFPASAQISISDRDTLLGAMRGSARNRHYVAVIEPDLLRSDFLEVEIIGVKGPDDLGRSPIPVHVSRLLGARRPGMDVVWTYDIQREQLYDERRNAIEVAILDDLSAQASESSMPTSSVLSQRLAEVLIPTARATEANEMDAALQGLSSSNLNLRRASRDTLAALGSVAVKPAVGIALTAHEDGTSAAQAGAIYSLSRMQRLHGGHREQIRNELTQAQIAELVKLLGAKDTGIRYYTADFLVGIGETRAAMPLVELLADADSSLEAKFNASVVLREIAPKLDEPERRALSARIDEIDTSLLGPRTQRNLAGIR